MDDTSGNLIRWKTFHTQDVLAFMITTKNCALALVIGTAMSLPISSAMAAPDDTSPTATSVSTSGFFKPAPTPNVKVQAAQTEPTPTVTMEPATPSTSTAPTTVPIPTQAGNVKSLAHDDVIYVAIDRPTVLDVLANDTLGSGAQWSRLGLLDINGEPWAKITSDIGTYEVVDNKIVFTPAEGFPEMGVEPVKYRAVDSLGTVVDGTFNLRVHASPAPPTSDPAQRPHVTTGGSPVSGGLGSAGMLSLVSAAAASLGLKRRHHDEA